MQIPNNGRNENGSSSCCSSRVDAPAMRLCLINPSNPLVSIVNVEQSRWNRYRVWKPLGLMVIAGLTPEDWDITIIDENLGVPDYSILPKPDLVGITAFLLRCDNDAQAFIDHSVESVAERSLRECET